MSPQRLKNPTLLRLRASLAELGYPLKLGNRQVIRHVRSRKKGKDYFILGNRIVITFVSDSEGQSYTTCRLSRPLNYTDGLVKLEAALKEHKVQDPTYDADTALRDALALLSDYYVSIHEVDLAIIIGNVLADEHNEHADILDKIIPYGICSLSYIKQTQAKMLARMNERLAQTTQMEAT